MVGDRGEDNYVPLAGAILDGLRAEILSGALKPGQRIRQQAVAAQYNASRLPVRQALQQLQAEGLITLTAHVGARVAVLSRNELDEIYKIRERLEPLALTESIPRLSPQERKLIGEMADRMERIGASDRTEWIILDRQFHLATYAGAPLPRLRQMIEGLWNATQHYRLAYTALSETIDLAHSEHRLLIEALDRCDTEDAARISEMHIRRTRLTLESRPELFAEDDASND